MQKQYWVYITTNKNNSVLYTGVTNNLARRIFEHKNKKGSAFTKKYNINKLVFAQDFNNVQEALAAEKKIKSGSRVKKIKLIQSINPDFRDLG